MVYSFQNVAVGTEGSYQPSEQDIHQSARCGGDRKKMHALVNVFVQSC